MVAGEVVRRAVEECKSVQASMATEEASLGTGISEAKGAASVKADETPVTALDFGLQGYVSERLKEAFPGDSFMGEESLPEDLPDWQVKDAEEIAKRCLGRSFEFGEAVDRGVTPPTKDSRVWILDPIDGTKGLITGQQYVVGLCLVDSKGLPLVAAMGNPLGAPSDVMLAVKGRGIRYYTKDEDLKDLSLPETWQARSFDYSKLAKSVQGSWGELGSVGQKPGIDFPPYLLSRPMDQGSPLPFGPMAPPSEVCCGALVKYWAVATGAVAGFIQYQSQLKSWDHAPGILCVQEAAGTATDAKSQPILFDDRVVNVDTAVVCCAPNIDQRAKQLFMDAVNTTP